MGVAVRDRLHARPARRVAALPWFPRYVGVRIAVSHCVFLSVLAQIGQYNLKRYFNVSIIDAKQVIAWNISPAFGTSFEQNPLISPGVSQSFVFKLFPVSYLIV